jgi:hypothetical protein
VHPVLGLTVGEAGGDWQPRHARMMWLRVAILVVVLRNCG